MRGERILCAVGLLSAVFAQDLPRGQIIDSVPCSADARQSYALYLPSSYSEAKEWPVVLAFDPGARGRRPVERYQTAAEKYGYIIAGSNVSRNGSWSGSMAAAQAMAADVSVRFRMNRNRVYTAGMSGGARVALGVALGSPQLIAGVVASAAAWPDSHMHKKVPFPVFGTAGTEDFNYREMRELDRTLTTPHRVVIFAGGHGWLPSELAERAVEWLDLQAMRSGRLARDEARIDDMLRRRQAEAALAQDPAERFAALAGIAADFAGLRPVDAPKKDKAVRNAEARAWDEEQRETQLVENVLTLEKEMNLVRLRDAWKRMASDARASEDGPNRRIARRAMSGLASSASERVKNDEYIRMVRESAGFAR